MIARDLADRERRAYPHVARTCGEPLTGFAQALPEEENRSRESRPFTLLYRSRGPRCEQLVGVREAFGRGRIGACPRENLRSQPGGVAQSTLRLLGVEDAFVPGVPREYDQAGPPGRGGNDRATPEVAEKAASASSEGFMPAPRIYPLLSWVWQRVQRAGRGPSRRSIRGLAPSPRRDTGRIS